MLYRTRRYAAAALVVPAVLMATACGTTQNPAGSSTNSSSVQTSKPAEHFSVPAEFAAALQTAAKDIDSVHVTLDPGTKTGEGMSADISNKSAKPEFKMSLKMTEGAFELISVGGTVYLKGFPGMDPNKWASMSESSPMAAQFGTITDEINLTKLFEDFDKSVTAVKYVTTETVDGVEADKYEVTIDETKMESSGKNKAALYTIWLDDKNRMVKATFPAEDGKTVSTMSFSKFGEPLDLKAPPAADVTKIPGS